MRNIHIGGFFSWAEFSHSPSALVHAKRANPVYSLFFSLYLQLQASFTLRVYDLIDIFNFIDFGHKDVTGHHHGKKVAWQGQIVDYPHE